MGKFEAPSDIREEDFDEKDRDLIKKLSSSLNPFQRNIFRILNGGLDYANLNRQLVENVLINIDSLGKVINSPSIKTTITGKVKGTVVISAQNTVNSSVYPTSQPFISFTLKEGLLTILNVSGLQANSRYVLAIEIIGQS